MQEKLLCDWIAADPLRMRALRMASRLGLPDWCIGAGFVRNLAWDRLHCHATPTPLADIDLIYFDAAQVSAQRDREITAALCRLDPGMPWSVHNQARMHERNGDPPYRSTEDAMSYWVEIETAVGVRLDRGGQLKIIAPFGLDSLFSLSITRNPKRGCSSDFSGRLSSKNWLSIWPKLRVGAADVE